ncbi:MAG: C1 family peptidase [Cyanobacteria bacterium P01_E01_bin.6]
MDYQTINALQWFARWKLDQTEESAQLGDFFKTIFQVKHATNLFMQSSLVGGDTIKNIVSRLNELEDIESKLSTINFLQLEGEKSKVLLDFNALNLGYDNSRKVRQDVANLREDIKKYLEDKGMLSPRAQELLDSVNIDPSDSDDDEKKKRKENIDLIDDLIEKIYYLPWVVRPPKKYGKKEIENIPVPIADSFLRDVFQKLLAGKGLSSLENIEELKIKQLIEPLPQSIYFEYAGLLMRYVQNTDIYSVRDSITYRIVNIKDDFIRFEKQVNFLGMSISEDTPIPSEIDFLSEHAFEQLAVYLKDVSVKYLGSYGEENQAIEKLISEQIPNSILQKINQLIYPIAKAVLRFIMPLGQYGNLDKAIERGLKVFDDLAEGVVQQSQHNGKSAEELMQMIMLVLQEGSPDLAKFSGKMRSSDEAAYLENIALTALVEIKETLESGSTNSLSQKLSRWIDKYQHKLGALEKGNHSEPQIFLEIFKPEHVSSSAQADLQVPVNWQLNNRIENALGQDKFKTICLSLPDFVDLSLWCSSIEDQGALNSCTAHAGIALTEYFSKKASGKYIDVSPLFLYKAARNLMQRQGDTGASVRETMKAMVLFGIPPEEHWPYDEEKFDEEPTSFCYSFAQNYQAIKYIRLDHAGIANETLLVQIKSVLVAGFPCMFGFTIYTSIYDEINVEKGYVPYPNQFDTMEGGHAVVAVGYDDHRIIENADGKRSKGAILIRNSWGTEWGEGGYGWLPYDYVLAGLTADWWSLFQSEWFESGQFGVGANSWTSDIGRRSGKGD